MAKLICPGCGSDNISTERRPDGYHHCLACGANWKNVPTPQPKRKRAPGRTRRDEACQLALRGVEFASEPDGSVRELIEAAMAAERFISNGVELGFIHLPDPETPDPAHDTLPTIRAALSRFTLADAAEGQ